MYSILWKISIYGPWQVLTPRLGTTVLNKQFCALIHTCMYICIHVCLYIYIYIYIYICRHIFFILKGLWPDVT